MSTTTSSPAGTVQTPLVAPIGNASLSILIRATIDAASVSHPVAAEQTFTVPGLLVGDFVQVNVATPTTGVGIGNVRVTAANTVGIQFINPTAGNIDPDSSIYTFLVTRPMAAVLLDGFPTSLPTP